MDFFILFESIVNIVLIHNMSKLNIVIKFVFDRK